MRLVSVGVLVSLLALATGPVLRVCCSSQSGAEPHACCHSSAPAALRCSDCIVQDRLDPSQFQTVETRRTLDGPPQQDLLPGPPAVAGWVEILSKVTDDVFRPPRNGPLRL